MGWMDGGRGGGMGEWKGKSEQGINEYLQVLGQNLHGVKTGWAGCAG